MLERNIDEFFGNQRGNSGGKLDVHICVGGNDGSHIGIEIECIEIRLFDTFYQIFNRNGLMYNSGFQSSTCYEWKY
jgi:hypothetical protein